MKLKAGPMMLVMSLATYPDQSNTLTVNGHEILLPINSQRSHFRRISVPLEAGTSKAVLKFTGQQGNLLMVRAVTLYQ